MTEYFDKLIKMSEPELIAIAEGKLLPPLGAKSTTTNQDIAIEARVILHNKQRRRDKFSMLLTILILFFTVIIALLTGLLVLPESCKNTFKPSHILKPPQFEHGLNRK